MAKQIVNAASMVNELGTQDLSKRQVPREPEAIPQHLPKFFLFTQKGPLGPQLVSAAEALRLYGDETFNLRGKYANHSTVFAQGVLSKANNCMLERVVPDDVGPQSNMTLWLDVLATTVDIYERNSDGSIKTTGMGDPIIVDTAQGYKVKWVVTHETTQGNLDAAFGKQTEKPGDQVDQTTSTQSRRYPICDLKHSSLGSSGDLSGIRMWAPTTKTISAMPSKMMSTYKAYPYFFSVIRRSDAQTPPKLVETLFGEQKMMVTFKENTFDPLTGKQLYIGDVAIDAYQNLTDLRYPKQYGDFEALHIYKNELDSLLGLFQTAELPFLTSESDFTGAASDKYLFNIISGQSSQGVPYHSFVFVDNQNSVRFTEYTNVYAAGGSDGTINDTIFANLVKRKMDAYLDPNDPVQEKAVNVESIFYDTGFPIETKFALCNAIAERKDTFVCLGTHVAGEPNMTASEEHSVAIALRTRLQMFPESDYFGTPVMRGMIVGRSAKVRNSQYTGRLPLTYELAIKSAKYMGSGDGKWKNGENIDGEPGHIVDNMYDISITWVPVSVRNRNWDVGLNWVQAFDRQSFYFPAYKTVYDDDTSVLNSYLTCMAIAQINKVANRVAAEFSGVDHLDNAQFAEKVNDSFNKKLTGRFDGRFVIKPMAQFTDMDLLRNFSSTVPVQIYAAGQKTVMTTYVQAFRIEDLAAK